MGLQGDMPGRAGHKRVQHATMALVTVCVALAATGCGSDEGSSPSQAPASTKTPAPANSVADHDEFVTQMNRLCRRTNAKLGKLNSAAAAAGNQEAIISALDDALGVYEVAVPQLESLKPPAEDHAAFERFVSAINRNESIVRRMGAAARSGATTEMAALSEAADAETSRRLKAALDLGADDCGRSTAG